MSDKSGSQASAPPTPQVNPPSGPAPQPRAVAQRPVIPAGPLGPALPHKPRPFGLKPIIPQPQTKHILVMTKHGVAVKEVTQFSYKTHWLVGLKDNGSSVVVERWDHAPTGKEVSDRIKAGFQNDYLSFALANAAGIDLK